MKKNYLSILASMFLAFGYATTHTVTNVGSTFTPPTLNITEGDTVVWTIGGYHNVVEVDMVTYNANGNTPLVSGFSTPFTGGMVVFDNTMIGMHYYVCAPHASGGMKGEIIVAAAPTPSITTVWINEIHYDNAGGDLYEGIEIAGPTGTDLSCYSLMFYNGNDSELYGNALDSVVLNGTIDDEGCSFGTVWFPISGIQNGSPDAVGLFNHCTQSAIQFLSYEGVITAGDGQFIGLVSEDVGVSQASSNPIGKTLQLQGSGFTYSDYTWVAGVDSTYGTINLNQVICNVVTPEVYFKTDSFEYNEGDGVVQLDSLLLNPALVGPTTESFEIYLRAASTGSAADFDITGLPIPIIFPQTISLALLNFTAQALEATLVDDVLIEGNEYVELVLRNAVGINIGADSILYLKIIDNDFPADTFVELSSNAATVSEGAGSFDINLNYLQTAVNTMHTVDLELVSGDVADIDNFATMTAIFNTLTEKFTVNITDDILVETSEVLTFALTNPTNGLFIGSDSIFTLTITDNDVPTYDLGLVEGNDATGADSLDLHGKFVGVVNSLDRGYQGLEFSIQSATGSVDVYSNSTVFIDSSVVLGDEVEIEGDIKFSNGMVRIENLVSLTVLSSSNALTPVVVTEINDANESDLVRMNGLTLVDPSQWLGDNTNAGFDVIAVDMAGDTVVIRIDRDYVDLYDASAPNSGIIDVVGIASQYDPSAPFSANHQIIPRDLSDIILYPTLNMDNQGTVVDEGAGTVTINFSVANDNGGSDTVDVELTSGTAVDIDNFTTQTVAITGGTGSITVTITDDVIVEGNESFEFTLTNASTGLLIGTANIFDLTINDNDADAIAEINVNALTLYPNPATEKVMLKMISNEKQIANISIVDVIGKTIQSNTFMLNNGTNAIELDLTKVANGNYMIHISTENGNHTENLLVR